MKCLAGKTHLTQLLPGDIRRHAGMEIVDGAGSTWRVVQLRDLGFDRPSWLKFAAGILAHPVETGVQAQDPMSLEHLQARLCGRIDANARWITDSDTSGLLDNAKIMRAPSVGRLGRITRNLFEF